LALKSIAYVKECVVLGDNQPYCSAVLWVDKPDAACKSHIDAAIEGLNRELGHPAQIKRYVVLENSPSFGHGNSEALKVKRQELLKRVEGVIDELYAHALKLKV